MGARISAWVFGGVVTLLYIASVIAAVGNLVLLPRMGAEIGYGITPFGWFWLWFGILMPVVVFAAALLLGRGRRGGIRVLLLLTGLAMVGAIQLEVMHLVPQSAFFG